MGNIFISFKKKNNDEIIKSIIEENYQKHYPILVEYTERINDGEDGVFEELNKKIEEATNTLDRGTYKNALSYYYLYKGDYEKHSKFGDEAVEEYRKDEYAQVLMLQTYSYLIHNAVTRNAYDLALKYCYEAIEVLDSNKSKYIDTTLKESFKVVIDCNFINIFVHNKLPEKAKKYYDVVKDYKKGDYVYDTNQWAIVFSKLIYNDAIGDKKETLKLTKEYYELAKETGSQNAEGMKVNIGKAMIREGSIDEALDYLLDAEAFYKNQGKTHFLGDVYIVFGEYYEAKKEYSKALEYYMKAYDLYPAEEIYYNDKKQTAKDIYRVSKEGNSSLDISKYLNEYIKLDETDDSKTGIVGLFSTMEEVNEKSYDSKLKFREQEKAAIEELNEEKKAQIGLLIGSVILLVMILVSLKKEIRDKKMYEKELKNMINKDFLTKCYSRIYGVDKVAKLMKENKKFSVGLIDIDNFKKVNDVYGHLIGDEALIMIGQVLSEEFKGDLTPVRYGGEEFLVIIEGEYEQGLFILERVRNVVEKKIFSDNLSITISGGIKKWSDESFENLVGEADKLLYKAKNSGKNKICS